MADAGIQEIQRAGVTASNDATVSRRERDTDRAARDFFLMGNLGFTNMTHALLDEASTFAGWLAAHPAGLVVSPQLAIDGDEEAEEGAGDEELEDEEFDDDLEELEDDDLDDEDFDDFDDDDEEEEEEEFDDEEEEDDDEEEFDDEEEY